MGPSEGYAFTKMCECFCGMWWKLTQKWEAGVKNTSLSIIQQRKRRNSTVLQHISKKRLTSALTKAYLAIRYIDGRDDVSSHIFLCNNISVIDFSSNFNLLTELDCLSYFRFWKRDIHRLVPVLGLPCNQAHTRRNRYVVSLILSTCLIL